MDKVLLSLATLVTLFLLLSCSSQSAEPVNAGRYLIAAQASGMVLDVPNSSTEGGTRIVQWTINSMERPSPNQVWRLVQVSSNNQWKIFSEHSKLCLDVNGKSHDNNASIIQWSDNGSSASNQIWSFVPEGEGYRIRSWESGKLITVFGISTEKGARLAQFEKLPQQPQNQIFYLIPVK